MKLIALTLLGLSIIIWSIIGYIAFLRAVDKGVDEDNWFK